MGASRWLDANMPVGASRKSARAKAASTFNSRIGFASSVEFEGRCHRGARSDYDWLVYPMYAAVGRSDLLAIFSGARVSPNEPCSPARTGRPCLRGFSSIQDYSVVKLN